MSQKTLQNIKSIIFALAIILGTTYVSAWTPAPAIPPANNVPAPINVGGVAQTRTGNLILTGLSTIDRLITGDLTVASTTAITVGQVLTATDMTGKVGWGTGGGGDSLTTSRGIQTKQGGLILQSRLSDGSFAQYGLVVENAPIKSTGGLIIETRTAAQGNPVSPENGRMWLIVN